MDVLGFQFKLADVTEAGKFSGFAAVFGNVDLQQDRLARGCFAKTLAKRGDEPYPVLWCHDQREPIGRGVSAVEDSYGLKVEGELVLSVPRASQVRDLMKAGVVKGLSIGYRTAEGGARWNGEIRELDHVELMEWSLCPLPANPLAQVTNAPKSAAAMTPADWDQFFRTGGFSKRDTDRLVFAVRQAIADPVEDAAIAELTGWLRKRKGN